VTCEADVAPGTKEPALHRGWTPIAAFLRRIAIASLAGAGAAPAQAELSNFVIIVADDLGVGDLGCYGGTRIRTPALDRIASEGVRLTEFYTPAPTCSPARAALLTGRHPLRTGITRVFVPKEVQGLPAEELTLAEHLRGAGYATACIGKWHLGGRKQYRPQEHGFDDFFGVLYSNNMVWLDWLEWPRFELFDRNQVIESPSDQSLLTRRYTQRALEFVEGNAKRPFLLYLAYTMPHVPLAVSEEFAGRSGQGLYADVVEELDASVGQLLGKLADLGLDSRTYVFFTSDNGPWPGNTSMPGGSTGGLKGSKGSTWEGGLRVPFLARAPGRFPADSTRAGPATLMDVFPTVSALAGLAMPTDTDFDGRDISALLRGVGKAPERDIYFSNRNKINAVRSGVWKLHLRERPLDKKGQPQGSRKFEPPLLYRLDTDPVESRDVAEEYPDVVDRMRSSAELYAAGLDPALKLRPFGRAIFRGLLTPAP
jgi:uncharacterized sulfatase